MWPTQKVLLVSALLDLKNSLASIYKIYSKKGAAQYANYFFKETFCELQTLTISRRLCLRCHARYNIMWILLKMEHLNSHSNEADLHSLYNAGDS